MVSSQQQLRFLIVDFLDSYTYNIPAFVRDAAPPNTRIVFHVRPYNELSAEHVELVTQSYHGVILSPGPGTVECADDLGTFTPSLLAYRPAFPVFGICLGFQAICKAFGGSIRRLSMPHHGIVSDLIAPDGRALGRRGTRYHSLEAILSEEAREILFVKAVAQNYNDPNTASIMEIEHRSLPFWGVQYHPESIYSKDCHVIAKAFLDAASKQRIRDSMSFNIGHVVEVPNEQDFPADSQKTAKRPCRCAKWEVVRTKLKLSEALKSHRLREHDFVLLDPGGKGEWSIFADTSTASSFRYSMRTSTCTFGPLKGAVKEFEKCKASIQDAWDWLREYSSLVDYTGGPPGVPFWGGFVGYFSYEVGLAQLGLEPYPHPDSVPQCDDIHLLWSTDSIVYHEPTETAYVISLNNNCAWLKSTCIWLEELPEAPRVAKLRSHEVARVLPPSEQSYLSSIEACQEQIKAGNSYELCLTQATRIHHSSAITQSVKADIDDRRVCADLFENLRSNNPAAYMSFLRLGGVTLLSASPEAFLSYDANSRVATMKPIKGTIGKTGLDGKHVSYSQAKEALSIPKVVAENLMIVDLIRNDLAKVCEKVSCPKLMWVEEIETLYQLVSNVQGVVKPGLTAWDLLQCSLPPGSMTGAPKRRSCQILQQLEPEEFRGLYSGIVGYVDVRGGCVTSVSIRNAVRYHDEPFWFVGAGGAITSLSDPQEEWEERKLKAEGVCRMFMPDFEILETILWDPTRGLMHWDQHVQRLHNSIAAFGFKFPFGDSVEQQQRNGSDGSGDCLAGWIRNRLGPKKLGQFQRLSLTVDALGKPDVKALEIPEPTPGDTVHVRLDPCSTSMLNIGSFVVHKTSVRDHYTSARLRAGVEGRDEVLLFRPNKEADTQIHPASSPDDLLTEGSYTNVAIFEPLMKQWITPESDCLPGIERARLLQSGDIVAGQIRRTDLHTGMRIWLFNSVRGRFEGIVD